MDGALVGGEEVDVLDQVADAVPRQHHLRGDHEIRPLTHRFRDGSADLVGVAVDVAAHGVQLGQRDSHRYTNKVSA